MLYTPVSLHKPVLHFLGNAAQVHGVVNKLSWNLFMTCNTYHRLRLSLELMGIILQIVWEGRSAVRPAAANLYMFIIIIQANLSRSMASLLT